ncbi:MAG: cytochrome b/b6 domain-containing protein, partial [Paracoccaceae bacterium]
GLLMSAARGRAIDIWGLTIFPALPETSWLSNVAGAIHETAPWFLVALVALHIGAALKHHVVDRDATLARMTSSRIAPRER